MLKYKSKILLVRVDRIGDLVLTLPTDVAFTERQHSVVWLIGEGLGFIPKSAVPRRQYIEIQRQFSWGRLFELTKVIRRHKFDAVLVYHAPWWISLAVWMARIPLRAGRLSQWHSFLFYNHGLRQSRSLGERHELEYNNELVEKCFHLKPSKKHLALSVASGALDTYIVIHPGMRGSALNWSMKNYASLIKSLSKSTKIKITGTEDDLPLIQPLLDEILSYPKVENLVGKLTPEALLKVLSGAQLVVAPSTGVAHLSAALGRPTLGFYSPVPTQHPKRWGPKGAFVEVVIPEVSCPAQTNCLGASCSEYDCMDRISVDKVTEKCRQMMSDFYRSQQ